MIYLAIVFALYQGDFSKMRNVTSKDLLSVLNRARFDARPIVRLIRASGLANIYPAVAVS